MDSKINKKIGKLLTNADALPIPFPATLLPLPDPPKSIYSVLGLDETYDLTHWKSLPADVKEDEVKRMHAFFFDNTDELSKFAGSKEYFMPNFFHAF